MMPSIGPRRQVSGVDALLRFAVTLALLLLSGPTVFAQVATGFPVYGSFGGGSFDTVNNANLNVHFEIPVIDKAGRGLPFTAKLTFDNSLWTPVGVCGSQTWTPATGWGWKTISSGSTGSLTFVATSTYCINDQKFYHRYTFGPYLDPSGTSHNVLVQTQTADAACSVGAITGGTAVATDGSGYTLVVTNTTSAILYSRSGLIIDGLNQAYVSDPNGNTIQYSQGKDTLGLVALTVSGSGTPSSPYTYSWTNPEGGQSSLTENFTQETVETNFGCSGVTDYGRTTQMTPNLVTSIGLPDGTSYTFQYEPTPNPNHAGAVTGRLHSITLPTGGVITYTYLGGSEGITCADGSAATLQRTTPDTGSNYWQYAHSEAGSALDDYRYRPAE